MTEHRRSLTIIVALWFCGLLVGAGGEEVFDLLPFVGGWVVVTAGVVGTLFLLRSRGRRRAAVERAARGRRRNGSA